MSVPPDVEIKLNETFEHLPRAPIVEAVIEIRAPAEAPWTEPAVMAELRAHLPDYPAVDSHRAFHHELRVGPGQEPQQTLRDLGWRGLRFQSADGLQVAQFNRDGFIFSRLQPYQSWEQFNCEGLRLWESYAALAQPSEVQRLGLRFINRIALPPQEVRFVDYIRPHAQPPQGLDLPFQGFFHHDVLAVPGHAYAINVIRTVQPPQEPGSEGMAVILDIDVYVAQPFKPSRAELDHRLAEMRWLKNKVFFGSVTKKALKGFRGRLK
jgi:uncharacterized protein (TIGR04255 family)